MVSNDWKNMPGYAGYEDSQTILTDTTTAIQAALTGQIGKKEEKLEEEMQENKPVIIEGRCWKFGDDIDTDIIIPTQWVCVPMEEMKHHAFEPLRPELADQLRMVIFWWPVTTLVVVLLVKWQQRLSRKMVSAAL